jgi:hypothetical protein
VLTINGDTAAVQGTGWTYKMLGKFANLWTVTFDDGRCGVFLMWNNEISG